MGNRVEVTITFEVFTNINVVTELIVILSSVVSLKQ
jgi:hypothetical protein